MTSWHQFLILGVSDSQNQQIIEKKMYNTDLILNNRLILQFALIEIKQVILTSFLVLLRAEIVA